MQNMLDLVQDKMAVDSFQLFSIPTMGTIVTMNFTRTVFAVHMKLLVKKMRGLRQLRLMVFERQNDT